MSEIVDKAKTGNLEFDSKQPEPVDSESIRNKIDELKKLINEDSKKIVDLKDDMEMRKRRQDESRKLIEELEAEEAAAHYKDSYLICKNEGLEESSPGHEGNKVLLVVDECPWEVMKKIVKDRFGQGIANNSEYIYREDKKGMSILVVKRYESNFKRNEFGCTDGEYCEWMQSLNSIKYEKRINVEYYVYPIKHYFK